MLRKGFASHYRYAIQRVGGLPKTSDKPEKNDWSNPHDALQYLELGDKGRYGVVSGAAAGKGRGRHGGWLLDGQEHHPDLRMTARKVDFLAASG